MRVFPCGIATSNVRTCITDHEREYARGGYVPLKYRAGGYDCASCSLNELASMQGSQ